MKPAIPIAGDGYRNQESTNMKKYSITVLNPVESVWVLQEANTKIE